MEQITGVVAVDQVDRQTEADNRVQRRGCDQVSAVQHRFSTERFCLGDCGSERLAMVVAVGDDADFQGGPPR